jgi:hypothetical protein
MPGFNLPDNFQQNSESLLRRVRPRLNPLLKQLPIPQLEAFGFISTEPSTSQTTPRANISAEKTICDYSYHGANKIPTGPEPFVGTEGFELKPGLINMVQESTFCGKASKDANAHV